MGAARSRREEVERSPGAEESIRRGPGRSDCWDAEIEADGFIDYFYVHPRAQGRGVGKALLAAVECEAVRLGVSLIYADVSITAKSFFLSQGFCITEAKSNVILGHPAPNFRMEKRPEQRKCHS